MSEKRKYVKSSGYWDKFNKPVDSIPDLTRPEEVWGPQLLGDPIYNATASYARNSGGSSVGSSRRNRVASDPKTRQYNNIREGLLPYEYSATGVDIRDAVELCQKAYANIAIFRNSIDMMSDFTNSALDLIGGNETSRKFIDAWFKKINIWNVKDQYFREYYKTSNVFHYVIMGKMTEIDISKIRGLGLNTRTNELPVRYILLNPYDISSSQTTSFEHRSFNKILSKYELQRLKDPTNEADKELFNNFPKDVQKKIKENKFTDEGLEIALDPKLMRSSFYKKQDYEPFSVPFGFPVLDDLNFKIELKKIDQAICRTIENVVLLLTMGAPPDKGGVVPSNITAMQNLFQNQSIGRVLVSDYTTKAEFILPDLKKVIGPEKYQIVNEDIKEGLQNIILNQEKFANTSVKAELFLQRLKEGRESFLRNFLQPEIDQICKNFGFRQCPTARFEVIDLTDRAENNRVITRMMELGILPPEEGIEVIETGLFPERSKLREAQKRFVEDRDNGWYNPIVGGVPVIPPPVDPNAKQANPATNNKTPNSNGRPAGKSTASFSVKGLTDIVSKTNDLYVSMFTKAKAIYKKTRLNKVQKEVIKDVCLSAIQCSEMDDWFNTAAECLNNPNAVMVLKTLGGVSDLAAEHNLDEYSSSLLYHSSKIKKTGVKE